MAADVVAPPPGFELEAGPPAPPDGFELEQPHPEPNMAAGNKTFSRVLGDSLTKIKAANDQAEAAYKSVGEYTRPAGQTVEDIGSVYAPVEAALNAGTGLLFGFPAYVGGGLGGLVGKYLLGNDADPKELAETMQKIFTYQPMTERGARLSGNVMLPLQKLQEGSQFVGERATDLATKAGASDDTAAAVGAVTDSTIQMLAPALLGELSRKMGGQTVSRADMANVAQVVAGPDATPGQVHAVQSSLHSTYEKTGIGPYTVMEQALKDPAVHADLVDPAVDVPKAFEQYVDKPEAVPGPVPGDGAPLLDPSSVGHEEFARIRAFVADDYNVNPQARAYTMNTVDAVREAQQLIGVTQLREIATERINKLPPSKWEAEQAAQVEMAARGVVDYHDKNLFDEQPSRPLPEISDVAEDLRSLGQGAGWAVEGGKMLRAPLKDGEGEQGIVTGRTPWIPHEQWFVAMRSELGRAGLSKPTEIQAAIEKAVAGEKLKPIEQRTVDWMRAEVQRTNDALYHLGDDEIGRDAFAAGLSSHDAGAIDLTAHAAQIDADAVERAAIAHENDDAAFLAEMQRIVRESSAEDSSASPGASGARARQSAAEPDAAESDAGPTGSDPGQPSGATYREGAGTLNAGLNPAAVLSGIRDSYTPFVGVAQDHVIKPPVDSTGKPKSPMWDSLQKIFAPAARGTLASQQAGIMRANFGEMARVREVALQRLKGIAADFDKMPVAENIKFIDAMERGTQLTDPKLAEAAKDLRELLDAKRDDVQALGKGQLENFDENYFPHMWKDVDAAQALFARRPLAGPGGFLKARTIPLTTDGLRWRAYDADGDFVKSFDTEAEAKLNAGSSGRVGKPLQPITTNPVELVLLKAREMDKYVYGQKIFTEMKDADLARFVKFGDRALPGWTKIDDKIARVFLPSDIPIREAYDARMMAKLNQFAEDIGVSADRRVNIGGAGRWGYASRSGEVATKFGGPESVLTHELGHQLDFQYGLVDRFVNDPATKGELRALADLRYEGLPDVPESYKKYVRKGTEKIANMVHAYVHMPERFQEVAPNTYAKFNEFLDEHPELSGLREIKPSLVLGSNTATVNAGGAVIAGEYHAPDEAATLINNHLSPGLQGNAFYDAWRGVGNAMNALQLGLSLFHVGFTTMDSMISKVALGVKQLSRGDVLEGAGNALQGLNPAQPFVNIVKGDRLLQAYLGKVDNPDLAPIVDAIQQAGGRVKMDDFYRNEAVNTFKQALRNADYGGAAKAFLPTVLDRISAPIFEQLVPRQKLGVFFDMAKDWLEKNPDADVAGKRQGLGALWDSVDNRMGQLVYDNVFWNRALKDGLMASVRSVGWNLGTFRELGGGVLDIKDIARDKGFSDRTAYVVALPLVAAIYGSVMHYAYNGTGPETLKDAFYPRTGQTRPDGSPDRVSLPTYMKDVFGYGEDLANFAKYGSDPTQTLKNKAHPLISTISQMLNNQDYFGGAIRNPADSATKQIMDEAAYLIQQIEPFSMRNYMQQAKQKGEEPTIMGYLTSPSMIGVAPAPGYITKSDEQLESAQVSRMREPLIQKYREALKNGAKVEDVIPEMIKGGLSKGDMRYVIKSSGDTPKPSRLKKFGADAEGQ